MLLDAFLPEHTVLLLLPEARAGVKPWCCLSLTYTVADNFLWYEDELQDLLDAYLESEICIIIHDYNSQAAVVCGRYFFKDLSLF